MRNLEVNRTQWNIIRVVLHIIALAVGVVLIMFGLYAFDVPKDTSWLRLCAGFVLMSVGYNCLRTIEAFPRTSWEHLIEARRQRLQQEE